MQTHKKGALTRISIVENARIKFNEKGIGLTIDQLANELGLTKSRITNHYPTKDSLFLAIITEYETRLAAYFESFDWGNDGPSFPVLKRLLQGAMRIQYDYRCSIAYSSAIMPTGNDLAQRIEATAQINLKKIKQRLKAMIDMGLLEERIVREPEIQFFLAGYLNLLTTWVTTIELYQSKQSIQTVQMHYLQAIFRCYIPYLTKKGKLNYQAAGLFV
jgi:AcrR family transcriptional regulator